MGYLELPDDEVPEENIWGHPERLEEWFLAVKQRRESGGEPVPQADEEEGMTGNELARDLIGD